MTIKKAKEQVIKISKMDLHELEKYTQNLFLVKHELDNRIFMWLNEAITIQKSILSKNVSQCMAVESELRQVEI